MTDEEDWIEANAERVAEAVTPARHGRSPFSDVAAVPRLQLVT